jgi:hypothetical protein
MPHEEGARRTWLGERFRRRIRPLADRFRDLVTETYGRDRGGRVQYIEAFEVSEYGAPLDETTRTRLFPFLPTTPSSRAFTRKEWVDLPEAD